ncbi:MAG: hypothetical protein JNJ59_17165 [Deltaproteobacteria bacterium]|nr:hypothetical protein [Deltaproteobacteria bacterium]
MQCYVGMFTASRLVFPGLAAVLSVAPACSNPVDTAENELPYLSEQDTTPDAEVEVTGECDCLTVGTWYRFDTLALVTIDGEEHPVIPTLNNLWKSDIEVLELNVMMEITDLSATEVKVRVLNGARVDGTQTICGLPDSAVELTFPREGCRLGTSSESSFNVYAGTLDFPKTCSLQLPVENAIPVAKARLAGSVVEECGRIAGGTVPNGALGQAELGKVCTCLLLPGAQAEQCGALDASYEVAPCLGCNANYQSLGGLLNAFGEPAWNCTTEDGAPAACITATWSAVRLEAGPADCSQ